MINASDIAHDAVNRHAQGETITPELIRAERIAEGATERQAATITKMACALIPTVTAASLRTWKASR